MRKKSCYASNRFDGNLATTQVICHTFMIGLLSSLETILLKSMSELLSSIPIDNQLKLALLDNEGNLEELLLFIISYEQDDFTAIPKNISIDELNETYLAVMAWANNTESVL